MSKPKINHQRILWVDLEMTGLNPETDKILELGAIVTDWRMNHKGSLTLVMKQDEAFIRKRFDTDFWHEHHATAEALIAQNSTGLTPVEFETQLIAFIKEQFNITEPHGDIVLAGNTIRADRSFIDHYLPEVAKYFHYRMLDVSAFKVLFEARYKKVFAKPENHRALEDIEGSIDELKYFMQYIKEK
ncbi:MAG: oligoribonuclease [Candidatus Saccharibacteria bacterium]|nr:oligoribonuclease [Candidatus Saccharibacteria bacterium]